MITAVQQCVTVEQYEFFALAYRSIIAYPCAMCFNVGMSMAEPLPSPTPEADSAPDYNADDSSDQGEIPNPKTIDRDIAQLGVYEGKLIGSKALKFLDEIGENIEGISVANAEYQVHEIVQEGLLPYISYVKHLSEDNRRVMQDAGYMDIDSMTVLQKAFALKVARSIAKEQPAPERPAPPPMPPRPRES